MRTKITVNIILIATFFMIGFFSFVLLAQEIEGNSDVEYIETNENGISTNWTDHVLRVKGNGFGPENIKELGRRKILAKRAAQADAYRNLLEAFSGVKVTSNTIVKDMMLESDSIKTNTEGSIKKMHIVDINYSNDGGCEVTVEVNLDESGEFLLSALKNREVNIKDDYPKFDWVALRKELELKNNLLNQKESELNQNRVALNSTRIRLTATEKELKAKNEQLASLSNRYDKAKNDLIAANINLTLTEEKLNFNNLKNEELLAAFDATQNDVGKTRNVLDEFFSILSNQKDDTNSNQDELEKSLKDLGNKKIELDSLAPEIELYSKNLTGSQTDQAKLQEYVKLLKQLQLQTEEKIETLFDMENSNCPDGRKDVFTALLIDARGLGVKPVLAPAIVNEKKQKLYGIGVIPIGYTGGSIVTYLSGDVEKVKKSGKIGTNPMMIKAVKTINGSDLMIRDSDSGKLGKITDLLELKKVAILL